MAKPPTSTRTVRLADSEWEALKVAAQPRELTVNGLIGFAVRHYLRSLGEGRVTLEKDRARSLEEFEAKAAETRRLLDHGGLVPLHKTKAFNPQPKPGKSK